jgi:hypothetical protein
VFVAAATLIFVGYTYMPWVPGKISSMEIVEIACLFAVFVLLTRLVAHYTLRASSGFAYGFLTVLALPFAAVLVHVTFVQIAGQSIFRGAASTVVIVTTFLMALIAGVREQRRKEARGSEAGVPPQTRGPGQAQRLREFQHSHVKAKPARSVCASATTNCG